MKLSKVQIAVLTKCADRSGIFADVIGMPVKQRSTAHALVRRRLAEWAPCQYPTNLPSIRLTDAGRAAIGR